MLAPIGAMLLFTAWLALLFAGLAAGGAVHLLLVVAAGVFPWRALGGRSLNPGEGAGPSPRGGGGLEPGGG
ncbi:MAG TPA: hypothetical protein VHN15_07570 [Thermoanaerobaculia bacterium]|nr:hypothetical protein [Thermoanaerobaculia bacterium]